jgi:heme A synthase
MKQTEYGISWRHRLAALVAVAAFSTIVLGTLVASNTAGTLIPSQAGVESFKWSLLSGGVKYEPAYRILAATSGLLAAGLAVSLWGCGAELHIRILGLANAAAGAIQVFLSGIPGSAGRPPVAGVVLTSAAEIFFALSTSLALFTRTDWNWSEPKVADVATPSFRSLLVFTTAATWIASILGTLTRPSVFLHLLAGCIVTLASLWAVEIALNKFSDVPGVKIPAILLAELAGLQLFLGIVAHSMELNARATALPMPGLIVIKTTHAAVGTLVLISSLFATFQAFKYLAPRSAKPTMSLPAETEVEACNPK